MKKQGFSRQERMLKRSEFLECFAGGRKKHSAHFIIFYQNQKKMIDYPRIGITVSKKVGNAVRRNRLKRLLREFFRLHKAFFLPGVDYSIVVKRKCYLNTLDEIVQELSPLLLKLRKSGNSRQEVSAC